MLSCKDIANIKALFPLQKRRTTSVCNQWFNENSSRASDEELELLTELPSTPPGTTETGEYQLRPQRPTMGKRSTDYPLSQFEELKAPACATPANEQSISIFAIEDHYLVRKLLGFPDIEASGTPKPYGIIIHVPPCIAEELLFHAIVFATSGKMGSYTSYELKRIQVWHILSSVGEAFGNMQTGDEIEFGVHRIVRISPNNGRDHLANFRPQMINKIQEFMRDRKADSYYLDGEILRETFIKYGRGGEP